MGVGTTGEACKRLGRTFIGIEKDTRYYKYAFNQLRDLKEFLNQK